MLFLRSLIILLRSKRLTGSAGAECEAELGSQDCCKYSEPPQAWTLNAHALRSDARTRSVTLRQPGFIQFIILHKRQDAVWHHLRTMSQQANAMQTKPLKIFEEKI